MKTVIYSGYAVFQVIRLFFVLRSSFYLQLAIYSLLLTVHCLPLTVVRGYSCEFAEEKTGNKRVCPFVFK